MNGHNETSLTPSRIEPPSGGPAATHILWIGDATLGQRFASRKAPHLHIRGCDPSAAAEQFAAHAQHGGTLDVLVIDAAERTTDALQIAALAESHRIDLPIILLVPLGQEWIAEKLSPVAVCDCIVKTQDFIHQLLPAVTQVRARHDLTTAFDVTRQREERVRTILETQPAVACIVEAHGRLIAVNRAGQALLGGSAEQLIGRNIAEFIPADIHAEVLPLFHPTGSTALANGTHLVRRVDGTTRPVHTRVVLLNRPDGPVSLVTMDDRTDSTAAVDAQAEARLWAEVEGLRAENQALSARQATLQDELRIAEEGRRASEIERARLAQSMVEHDEFHARVRAELESERERLAASLQELENRHHTLLAERQQWETAAAERRDETAALQQEHERAMSALAHELSEQAAAVASLTGERDRIAGELATARAQCETLASERVRWEESAGERVQQDSALSSLRESYDQAASSLEAAVVKHQWLAAECERLEGELATERSGREQLLGDIQSERDRAIAERDQIAAERDRLRNDLEQLAAERNRAPGSSADARAYARGASHREAAQLAHALQEAQRHQSASEAERNAERAQWMLAATRAADEHRTALRAVESECERLTDELCKAEAQLAERHASDAVQRDLDRSVSQSTALELRAAQERIHHLAQEVTELQTALSQADARSRALRRASAAAEAKAGELSERFERFLDADRADLLQLRRGMAQFLADADRQCKTLAERRASVLLPWEVWPGTTETQVREPDGSITPAVSDSEALLQPAANDGDPTTN